MITLEKTHKVTLTKASDLAQNRKVAVHNLDVDRLKRNDMVALARTFNWFAVEKEDLSRNDPLALRSEFRRQFLVDHTRI